MIGQNGISLIVKGATVIVVVLVNVVPPELDAMVVWYAGQSIVIGDTSGNGGRIIVQGGLQEISLVAFFHRSGPIYTSSLPPLEPSSPGKTTEAPVRPSVGKGRVRNSNLLNDVWGGQLTGCCSVDVQADSPDHCSAMYD